MFVSDVHVNLQMSAHIGSALYFSGGCFEMFALFGWQCARACVRAWVCVREVMYRHGPMHWWPSWISQHTGFPPSWWANFSQQVKWDTALHNLLFHPSFIKCFWQIFSSCSINSNHTQNCLIQSSHSSSHALMYIYMKKELFPVSNFGLSQSLSMQKLNQKCISVRGGYVSAVAKQLHASKSQEFKQWKRSSFPGDSFQRRSCHKGALVAIAAVAACLKSTMHACICVCFLTVTMGKMSPRALCVRPRVRVFVLINIFHP